MFKFNKILEKSKKTSNPNIEDYRTKHITTDINKNIDEIMQKLGNSHDLQVRTFNINYHENSIKVGILYINGLIDQKYVNETVIDSIVKNFNLIAKQNKGTSLINKFDEYILTLSEVKKSEKYGDLYDNLLAGDTIILLDHYDNFFYVGTRLYPERAITEPKTHISVKGPKDSFTESMSTNISLIRLRIKNPDLWVKRFIIGEKTKTDVSMVYLKDTADESLVNEVTERLNKIQMDNILDSSYITAAIKETKFSLFPTIYENERPDVIVANILEGRVVIIINGSPFAIVVPTLFIQFFHSVEDYYQKSFLSTFFRILRIVGFIISLFLPSLYITLIAMHSELVPFPLLIKIAAQREGLPFPTWLEAVLLCFLYDLLREAALRMPTALGSAISIVGALVLGEASIQAGIMSPIMLIIVSTTAIATLVIPSYSMQLTVTVLKYVFILISSLLGLFGMILSVFTLLIHLGSLRSFGISYLTPISPLKHMGQKDAIYRSSLKKIFKRPKNISEKYPE